MKTSQGTLFVVDDDCKSRRAMAALASSMKIKCETFGSAEEFLDRHDPCLRGCALVDFRLGGMNGLELQDRLRAMGSVLYVVVISAYADAPLVACAMRGGAVAFIEKPYKNDDLADAIRTAMERSAHARQSPRPAASGSPGKLSAAVRGGPS
ncbi:MAG: response regulator [Thermoguttaceae bacterium]|jgi:FixJ family two-component response regulator